MGMTGGISVKVMPESKGRVGDWGRECQAEGTAGAKTLRQKRSWHISGTGGKPMWLEHNRPKTGKHEMTLMK